MGSLLRRKTVAVRTCGDFLVVVHGRLPPSTREWNDVIATYRAHPNVGVVRVLVYSDGGSPNAAQRADLTSAITNRSLLTSVVTSSVLARAAGTAIAWLLPGLRIFSPSDLDKALEHIGAGSTDRRLLRDAVDQLRRDVSQEESATSEEGT